MATVQLQPVMGSDASELIAANCANQNYHRPWVTPFRDQAGFDVWFGRIVTGPNIGLLARESASKRIVGVINLNEIVMGAFRSAYLGYYGMADFSQRGLMTQALRMAIDFAFSQIGLHRLEANIQPANGASIALVRKSGFQQEGFSERYLQIDGEWRDHERWALLNTQAHGINAP